MDGAVGEISRATCKIAIRERLRTVALFHRIDEAGLLIVAKVRKGSDVHCSHHLVVFVDQVVAVELYSVSKVTSIVVSENNTYHVETIPRCVASDDVDFFVGVQPNNILERLLLIGSHTT